MMALSFLASFTASHKALLDAGSNPVLGSSKYTTCRERLQINKLTNQCIYRICPHKKYCLCFALIVMDHCTEQAIKTLGSPIREIATLRRRFMPPLYCETSVSATPPSNIFSTFIDCSAAWKEKRKYKAFSRK